MTRVDSDRPPAERPGLAATLPTIVLCWLALLWPAIYNGGPLLFVDTTAYVRGVDAGVASVFGVSTAWSTLPAGAPAARAVAPNATTEFATDSVPEPAGVASRDPAVRSDRITLAGRSIYYGALPYLSYLLVGGLGAAIAVQALLVAIAATLTAFRFGAGRVRGLMLPVLLLGLSAPYFASFAMPDIFVPLAILAFANIAAFWTRDGGWPRAFWSGLLSYSALTHTGTLLLVALLACGALLLRATGHARVPGRAAGAIVAAVVAGIAGEILFSAGVRGLTGHAPVRPPFLTARIVDDGPGYRYLAESCPGNGFLLCGLIDRPPVNSDAFLWSSQPGSGAFLSGSPAQARGLAAEQGRFAFAVLRDRPIELLGSSLGAIGRQARMTGLSEFNYDRGARDHFTRKLPVRDRDGVAASPAHRGRFPVRLVERLVAPIAFASLAIIGLACVHARRPGRALGPATVLALVVLAGIVANFVISGAISTPHDRYNMRALWLLPLLAAALLPLAGRRAVGDDRGTAP